MKNLNLDFDYLDSLFDLDFSKHELRLRPNVDGSLQTSINLQQLYNWYRNKQMEAMWAENMIDSGGFKGLQPAIIFKSGFRLFVPEVPVFTIHGTVFTEVAGEYPYVHSAQTRVTETHHARPHGLVFLSHAMQDKPFMRKVRAELWSLCDVFFDENALYPSVPIWPKIYKEIALANLVVVVHSESSARSKSVQKEWTRALMLDKPILVVKLDRSDVPLPLRDRLYVHAENSTRKVFDEISAALGGINFSEIGSRSPTEGV